MHFHSKMESLKYLFQKQSLWSPPQKKSVPIPPILINILVAYGVPGGLLIRVNLEVKEEEKRNY